MVENGPIEYFICGGFGGICTVLSGHPFDTLKVRLQTMPVPPPGQPPLYSGMLDCIRKTIAREGILGLYKGMGAPLVAVAPIFAISFMGYKIGKQIFNKEETNFTYLDYFFAGAFSGIFTTVIMTPGERVKCILQVQQGTGQKKYNGSRDVITKLYQEGGIRSIYRGTFMTLLRDVPASGGYYMTYECIQNYLTDNDKTKVTILGTLFAGGCAGVSNWLIGMPSDVVKSRLQTAPEGTYPNGSKDVVAQLMKQEGFQGFYRGLVPVLVRSFPANAACFLGFEICRYFFRVVVHGEKDIN